MQLTLRIEPKKATEPQRIVMAASRYTVTEVDTAVKLVVDDTRHFTLENGGVAYIMNDRGVTIDIVRTYPPDRK